jgi:hypothetical protein
MRCWLQVTSTRRSGRIPSAGLTFDARVCRLRVGAVFCACVFVGPCEKKYSSNSTIPPNAKQQTWILHTASHGGLLCECDARAGSIAVCWRRRRGSSCVQTRATGELLHSFHMPSRVISDLLSCHLRAMSSIVVWQCVSPVGYHIAVALMCMVCMEEAALRRKRCVHALTSWLVLRCALSCSSLSRGDLLGMINYYSHRVFDRYERGSRVRVGFGRRNLESVLEKYASIVKRLGPCLGRLAVI